MTTILAKSTSDCFVCGWRIKNSSTLWAKRPWHCSLQASARFRQVEQPVNTVSITCSGSSDQQWFRMSHSQHIKLLALISLGNGWCLCRFSVDRFGIRTLCGSLVVLLRVEA